MPKISEPSKGLLLNAAQVKNLTGNDTINARFLHENSFDFRPQFKIYMNTNYLPVVTDMTLFSSGRIMIIPFERHFEENQQDKTLKHIFSEASNQSAILNWLLEGYRSLENEGLAMPESVRFATERYRHESDKIGLFIEDELEPIPNAEERTSVVYDRYRKWCDSNGCFAENTRNFKQILAMYGRVTEAPVCWRKRDNAVYRIPSALRYGRIYRIQRQDSVRLTNLSQLVASKTGYL